MGRNKNRKDFVTFFLGNLEKPTLIDFYRDLVKNSRKFRLIKLPGRRGRYFISKTLLGYLVESSSFKLPVDRMEDARFLKLFCEMGAKSVFLPENLSDVEISSLEMKRSEIEEKIYEIFPFSIKRRLIKKYRNKVYREIVLNISEINRELF